MVLDESEKASLATMRVPLSHHDFLQKKFLCLERECLKAPVRK